MNRRDAIKIIGIGGAAITVVGFPKTPFFAWDTDWTIHCTWITGETITFWSQPSAKWTLNEVAEFIQDMRRWEFAPTTVVAVAKNGQEFRFAFDPLT